mgnify:CR=1 FL=1
MGTLFLILKFQRERVIVDFVRPIFCWPSGGVREASTVNRPEQRQGTGQGPDAEGQSGVPRPPTECAARATSRRNRAEHQGHDSEEPSLPRGVAIRSQEPDEEQHAFGQAASPRRLTSCLAPGRPHPGTAASLFAPSLIYKRGLGRDSKYATISL